MCFVLLGGGIASITCARKLKELRPGDELVMVSGDKYPYSRMVLPNILKREIEFKNALLSVPKGVKFRGREKVISIDFERKFVYTPNGKLRYDKLLIATGSEPNYLFEEKHNSVVTVRNIEDVRRIEESIQKGEDIIVFGGGFVSLEIVDALIKRGVNPEVIVSSDYPLSRMLDEESGDFLKNLLMERGIKFRFDREIKAVKAGFIFTDKGEKLPCKLLIAGKGVIPALQFVKRGEVLKINKFMETEFEDVYAAGDVVKVYDIVSGKYRPIPIWPVASLSGWYAALNMAGIKAPYTGFFPYNFLKTLDISIFVAGDMKSVPHDVLLWKKGESFAKAIIKNGVIKGIVAINVEVDIPEWLRIIREHVKVEWVTKSFPWIRVKGKI